jgi:hypothetical protein
MPALPQARVRHLIQERLRIKIPERRRDERFFKTLEERLAAWDSIKRVEVNPLTASVLVYFTDLRALFAENALKNDLFEIDYDDLDAMSEEPPDLRLRAAQSFARADAAVRRWTAGNADLRSAFFAVLLAGGVVQLLRGRIAGPATSMLWHAGDILRLWDVIPGERGPAVPEETLAEG